MSGKATEVMKALEPSKKAQQFLLSYKTVAHTKTSDLPLFDCFILFLFFFSLNR